MLLDRVRHILVMVLLVPHGAQQIEHLGARVLALLAERVFEVLGQVFEKVHVRAQHVVGDGLERLQAGRGRVARLPFEVVRDVAEEVEPVFGRPEEGVDQHRGRVGAGGWLVWSVERGCWAVILPVPGILSEHLSDEIVRLVRVIAQSLQIVQIVQALDNVGFSHVSAVFVEGVVATSEHVVEYAS